MVRPHESGRRMNERLVSAGAAHPAGHFRRRRRAHRRHAPPFRKAAKRQGVQRPRRPGIQDAADERRAAWRYIIRPQIERRGAPRASELGIEPLYAGRRATSSPRSSGCSQSWAWTDAQCSSHGRRPAGPPGAAALRAGAQRRRMPRSRAPTRALCDGARGGRGAVREACELLMHAQGTLDAANGGLPAMRDRLISWSPCRSCCWRSWRRSRSGSTASVQPPAGCRDGSTRHDPDFIVEGFSAVQMNPDGTRRYALSAKRMVHYPDDNSTLLEAPRLVLLRLPKALRSRSAPTRPTLSQRRGRRLFPRRRPGGPPGLRRRATPNWACSPATCTSFPDQDLAQTDQPVTHRRRATRTAECGWLRIQQSHRDRSALLSEAQSKLCNPEKRPKQKKTLPPAGP